MVESMAALACRIIARAAAGLPLRQAALPWAAPRPSIPKTPPPQLAGRWLCGGAGGARAGWGHGRAVQRALGPEWPSPAALGGRAVPLAAGRLQGLLPVERSGPPGGPHAAHVPRGARLHTGAPPQGQPTRRGVPLGQHGGGQSRRHSGGGQQSRRHSGGGQQYRFRQYQGWEGGPSPSRATLLVRPLLFTASVVLGSLALAAIIYSERRAKDHWTVRMGLQPPPHQRHQVHDLWGWRLTTGQLVAAGLIAANVTVYGLWVLARGRGRAAAAVGAFLQRNFLLYPFAGRGFPLLGSTFSHVEFLHLGFNMIALWSFAPLIVSLLGPETFMATYLSSAVLTSLGGMLIHLGMTVTLPSCGASGAILFLFSTSALLMPTASYRIIFLPFFAFSGPQLLAGVVALDLAGLIMGWKMFNHGAHLTGAILGVLFVNGGGALIHRYQVQCIKTWRSLTKGKK